jgi:FkbM family methyltransferase
MQILKNSIQKLLSLLNLRLVRVNTHSTPADSRSTIKSALNSMLERGYLINTVIDIGASDGRWSEGMMSQYPNTSYFLIEAQECHLQKLKEFVARFPNANYELAAAGAEPGNIFFDASNPFGGQASSTPFQSNNIVVPVTSVDAEVEKHNLKGPFLIKFDTHGYETPILKGAHKTLENTSVIIMECYVHRLTKDSLLFNEMCAHLDKLGFRCIDMIDPVWRTYDDTFWQMDLIFIKKDSIEFSYLNYE